ncbi:MAG: hypothetical protein WAX14_13445 [Rhodococcus sp. (in: high G+C Gram-positive bacteria)]|uniref:hypothetical protein n=1 Tax=Rhodococcus sp. TaxID=1831 RepID=UPI003BB7D5E0
MRPTTFLTCVLTACVLTLTACGAGDADVPPLPEEPTPADATVFTARTGLLDPQPVAVTSWSPVADDRIAVHFQTGTPECYGVDATVTETTTSVSVSLLGGMLPEAEGQMCIMVAVDGVLEVPLQSPLAERTVTTG